MLTYENDIILYMIKYYFVHDSKFPPALFISAKE